MNMAEIKAVPIEVSCPPDWFLKYSESLVDDRRLAEEQKSLEGLGLDAIKARLGGDIKDLPYPSLQLLFPKGSDDEEVGAVLREKRTEFSMDHPEILNLGDSEGIISADGVVVLKSDYDKMTAAQKRGVMVGRTCFHYESGRRGMSDTDESADI